ncbi:hypothetical protein BD779DRAFT_663359 [Infundibulicybe gibba]|nr:hypothetical protein BD779DRAFT_663359 [Infundibulicybe gibba]
MRDLVHMLGFYETSVEMLYYNSEPQGGPRTCSSGQQAPTATRFKEKFAELLRNVQPGDVRFLYIDAHSSPRAEPGVDDGWELAQDENGRRDEIVYGDWITRCIKENLVRGVNLTILTPLGPRGCISDNTPGIIFAGCHEVQTSVKALNDMDPWTVAIAEVIERHKESCRPIPTYAQLYTSARKFITDWIRSGELSTNQYLGPSLNGANPDGSSSHQDPQLVFCEDHINVNTERFLCPLAREGWNNVGLAKRFPKDEL